MVSNDDEAQRKRETDGHHFAGKHDEVLRSKLHCNEVHDACVACLKETRHLLQDGAIN